MVIRDYEAPDFPFIMEIERNSEEVPAPQEFVLTSIENGRAWVAIEGDEIVGFIIGKLKHGIPYVNNVAVSKDHRNKGIATRLFSKFEEYFGAGQKPENKIFWLQVNANNPAQKLYFDLGYRVGWIDEHYYGDCKHALNMYKSTRPIANKSYSATF